MRALPAGTHGAFSGASDVRSIGGPGLGAGASLGPIGQPPKGLGEVKPELGSSGGLADAAHAGDYVVPAEHGNDLTRPPLQGGLVPQCLSWLTSS